MKHLASVCIFFFLLSTFALAQAGAPANPPQQPPLSTFVSRSELVLVPVVVTDKSGHHVPGLTKSDFVLQEDGKTRSIAVFDEIASSAVKPIERKRVEGQFTNFSVNDASPRHMLIIVLDLVNTPFPSQARARNDILDFLSKSLRMDEPTALLAITSDGVHELHPFTTDTKILIAALKRVRGKVTALETTGSDGNYLSPEEEQEVAQEEGQIAVLNAKSNAIFSDMQQRNAIRSTMLAMEQIAQAYMGIPGRKTMMWATSGFPFLLDDPHDVGSLGTDMIHYYEHAWRALSDANVAIYPINAEGLANSEYDRNFSPSIGRASSARQRTASIRPDRYHLTLDTMRSFADATGGKPCIDRNDLSACFTEAVSDSEQYYVVGFYLGTEQRKPGWHKLKVQVARDHTHVRARSGYLAGDPKLAGEQDVKMQLATALVSPLDYTGVAMDVKWLSQTPENGNVKARFSVKLPASSFTIDATHKNAVSLELAAIAFTPQGKPGPEMSKSIVGNLQPESMPPSTPAASFIRTPSSSRPGSTT